MISKTSVISIKAFVFLARLPEGQFDGAAKIAREISAAENYLGKILQSLSGKGFLTSQKGSGGGFRLNRDPDKITLFDIVDSVENIGDAPECFFGLKVCSSLSPCAVHSRWKIVREEYMNFLKHTTIADLSSK